MPSSRSSNIATPGFDPQIAVPSALPGTAVGGADRTDAAIGRVAEQLGHLAGGFGDSAAQREGQEAGAIAGLDPNWRPSADPTIRGEAYRQAAQDTYVNRLQTQARQALADAWHGYSTQPLDRQNPAAFKTQLDGLQRQFERDHVFPSILPNFRKQWDAQVFAYTEKARDDNDQHIRDASNAAFIGNQQSVSDSAMRAASLVTPAGDALAQTEADAHDRLVDAQVNSGAITAVAGQKLKGEFRQGLSQTAIMAKFAKLDPAGQKAFLDDFTTRYGTGRATGGGGDFFDRLGQVESGNDDSRVNPTTGAFSRWQFLPSTARGLGVDRTSGPGELRAAANKLDAGNVAALTKALGRAPTDGERYLAWQQGAGGAAKLLANPDKLAVDVMGRDAVLNNGGSAAMTAGAFAALWQRRFAGAANPTNGLTDASYETLRGQMAAQIRAGVSAGNELTAKSVREIDAARDQVEGGFALTPARTADLSSRFAASADPKVADAYGTLVASQAMVAKYRGLRPEEIEADVANARAALTAGATPAQRQLVEAAANYAERLRKDLASNPIGRAAQEGIVSGVKLLDAADPDLGQAVADRVVEANLVAKAYDQSPRLFLPGEGATLARNAAKVPGGLAAALSPDALQMAAADDGFRTALAGGAGSTDPGQAGAAFAALDVLQRTNPVRFAADFGTDTAKRVTHWEDLIKFHPPAEAAAMLAREADPAFETVRQRLDHQADEALKDVTAADVATLFSTRSVLNPFSWGGGVDMPAGEAAAAAGEALRSDYALNFREAFRVSGDKDQAKASALKALQGKWGASPTNGNRVMPYPPELKYPAINGSKAWIGAQLDADVHAAVGDPGRAGAPRALVTDATTEAEIAADRLPSYRVVVQDGDGRFHLLEQAPGKPFRFRGDPDKARAAAEDRFSARRNADDLLPGP